MSVNSGDKITADYYNSLAALVNELYGDTHGGQGPSANPVIENGLRWGWGGQNANTVVPGNIVTAVHTNELVKRINLSTLRTNSTSQELVIVNTGATITAEFFNTATSLLQTARNVRNHVKPDYTSYSTLGTYTHTPNWTTNLENSITLNFGGYENARYFFNAGGDIRLSYSITGGDNGPGYRAWLGLFQRIGTLKFNVQDCVSINDQGITENKGFSSLLTSEQQLYTSPGGGGQSYGSYGGYQGGGDAYGSSRLKLYGTIVNNNLKIRTLLDHSTAGHNVKGPITMTVTITYPTPVTENGLTLTIPSPDITLSEAWREF
jgi:hypothetical protein